MKPIYLVVFFFGVFFFENYHAQQNVLITDNTATVPDASSLLELNSTTKGLLIPRVSLTSVTDGTTITLPASTLLVYNTNPAIINGAGKGYYYNDGTSLAPNWQKIISGNTSGGGEWKLIGNSGTIASTNFLGTIDNVDLVFRTNNTEKMRIMSGGNVGIGTATPAEKLDVVGNLQFSQALMPNGQPGTSGQVLISQGANTAPIWGAGGGPSGITVYTSGSGTYTVPSGVTKLWIRMVGGGGAGGSANWPGCAGNNHCGAGGGAGGYCESLITSPATSYSYSVGGGGAASTTLCGNAGGKGGDGVNSTFGSLTANAGIGGGNSTSGSSMFGGAGGGASGANINIPGQRGLASSSGGTYLPGNGGSSILGFGGTSLALVVYNNWAGQAGQGYGSGGSGAASGSVSQLGGNGAGGIIIIYEYK